MFFQVLPELKITGRGKAQSALCRVNTETGEAVLYGVFKKNAAGITSLGINLGFKSNDLVRSLRHHYAMSESTRHYDSSTLPHSQWRVQRHI